MLRFRRTTGFTLLELLVAIAIVGLLSTMTILTLSRARQKARDTRRIADIEQLQRALELYALDHENNFPAEYPPSGFSACSIDTEDVCWWAEGPNWIPGMVPTYASALPIDPRGFPQFEPYKYRRSFEYGYLLTFKTEVLAPEDECDVVPAGQPFSSRCARLP